MACDFVILDFSEPEDPPVAYAEGLLGDLCLISVKICGSNCGT
jgi:hypothetical protein